MFEGFERSRIDTGSCWIHVVHGGAGSPVLMLATRRLMPNGTRLHRGWRRTTRSSARICVATATNRLSTQALTRPIANALLLATRWQRCRRLASNTSTSLGMTGACASAYVWRSTIRSACGASRHSMWSRLWRGLREHGCATRLLLVPLASDAPAAAAAGNCVLRQS